MRILVVTPYPPIRDGIANYAVQEVKKLRGEGHDVEVLSPYPSAAHHHLALRGPRGPLALAKRVAPYDKVIIQFHPDVFYSVPFTLQSRDLVTLGLHVAFKRCRSLEVRIHEVDHSWGVERTRHRRLFRALWRIPDRITVHTRAEARLFVESFGVDPARVEVFDHGGHFERRTDIDRVAARERLGIPADEFVFLSIGFIQRHKGFDRAVRAFGRLGAPRGARLDIVGSVRVEEPEHVAYLEELTALVDQTPNAHLHVGYVGDDRFDEWLVAADRLVLPYRHIWSSGVIERAALYGRDVIATRVGGLEDQAPSGTVLVDDDDELVVAMRGSVGLDEPGHADVQSWTGVASGGHDAISAAIRGRAALERASGSTLALGLDGAAGQSLSAAHATGRAVAAPAARSSEAFAALPVLCVPSPSSSNPVGALAKRLVHRLTYWQVAPIVHQLNALREAGVRTVADPVDAET